MHILLITVLLGSTISVSSSLLSQRLSNPMISIFNDDEPNKYKSGRNQNKIACKDEDGNAIDWFIVYKLPKIPDAKEDHLVEGSAHYYLLPGFSAWKKSSFAINDSRSLVGQTVEPLNTLSFTKSQQTHNKVIKNLKNSDLAVVLYNDQPPDVDPTIRNGHTKGVLMANENGGFWMPHSVPHFPRVNKSFDYPPGGLENGQMFMCMNLPLETLDNVVGGLLGYTRATFYNSSISPNLQTGLSQLYNIVMKNFTVTQPPWYKTFQLTTGKLEVSVFAKGPKFRREIYADWIAPTFESNLDVQSWLNGANPFMSNCSSNCSVYNIMEKQMFGQNFSYSDDHSKWAVGTDKTPLTCITDLNRMKPQKSRGGIGLCVKDDKIWTAFKSLVVATQPCEAININNIKNRKHKLRQRTRTNNKKTKNVFHL